ncbi:MAG: hypothetical protein ACFB9M_03930 [Myxococcota bacterium]
MLQTAGLLPIAQGQSPSTRPAPTPPGAGPVPRPEEPEIQTTIPGMDDEQLDALLRRVDPNFRRQGAVRELDLEERAVVVISDARANRMRIMTAITPSEELPADKLRRLLQANFDSALDARYAVAQGMVWSVFVHPLGSLSAEDALSGLAQVVVAAESYGTSFTSGALVFGGGDSAEIQQELYERLLQKGRGI